MDNYLLQQSAQCVCVSSALSRPPPLRRVPLLSLEELGEVLTDLHKKPGQLRDILGPRGAPPQEQAPGSNPIADMLSSPMAKAVLAGIAAMVVKRVMRSS
jgi:hypothetical protein